MKIVMKVFFVTAVAFAAGACTPTPRNYDLTIVGRVIDANGNPIPGAIIGSEIVRRCGNLGGGSTSPPIGKFRAKTDSNGHFELQIRRLFFGYVSFLSGCTTAENRFACKPGYDPMLEFNYLTPDKTPIKGRVDVTYTLKSGPPQQASQISFMSLANDALRCKDP